MKNAWIFFLIIFCGSIFADENLPYERTLKAFTTKKLTGRKEVRFILDNDWVLFAEVPALEENKIYSLDNFIGKKVRIHTDAQFPILEMTFENPSKAGFDKTSFLVSLTRETYNSLLTVTDIETNDYLLFSTGYITLSDGSVWYVKTNLGVSFAYSYWSSGDKILVTKKYNEKDTYTLVNLDVSGDVYVDYYKNRSEHWFCRREPRCLDVTFYKNESEPLPIDPVSRIQSKEY